MTQSDRPAPVGATEQALEALRELVLAAHGFRKELADALGLTVSDTVALSHLVAADGLSAGELAQRSGLAPSSVTAMLDRLERAGLVRRSVRPENRRSFQISLTERGRSVMTLSGRWMGSALDTLGKSELPGIARQLTLLAEALRRETGEFGAAVDGRTLEALLHEAGLPEEADRTARRDAS